MNVQNLSILFICVSIFTSWGLPTKFRFFFFYVFFPMSFLIWPSQLILKLWRLLNIEEVLTPTSSTVFNYYEKENEITKEERDKKEKKKDTAKIVINLL